FSRLSLATGSVVFSGALIFSFSRASVVNLLVAGIAYLLIRGVSIRRLLTTSAVLGVTSAGILRFTSPLFFAHYLTRLAATFQFFQEAPNRVLSGRIASWETITAFLAQH